MKLDQLLRPPPCGKCPYKLGLVRTFVNPCPQCKENGYRAFEQFQKRLSGEHPADGPSM